MRFVLAGDIFSTSGSRKKELFWGICREINFSISGQSAALNMGITREVFWGINQNLPSPRDMEVYIFNEMEQINEI